MISAYLQEQERRYEAAAQRQQEQMNRETKHIEKSHKDYGKSFRSRPGSADWKASCSCGWEPKSYYYGKSGAHAAWLRHSKQVSS